jgi:hypothetical protein
MWKRSNLDAASWGQATLIAALCLTLVIPAAAHNGPPFPIVENRRVGPFIIAVWTHPDLGTGTFFVIVAPTPGVTIPKDLKVKVAVQPETGRLPEAVYDMWRDRVRDHVQFDNTQVEFDKQEYWRVRLVLESSIGGGEVFSRVEPTPTGLGKWDLLLYAFPFAFVIFLWFRGMSRRRKRVCKNLKSTPVAVAGLTGLRQMALRNGQGPDQSAEPKGNGHLFSISTKHG